MKANKNIFMKECHCEPNSLGEAIHTRLSRRPIKIGLLSIIILISQFFTFGCKDVITVDLNSADPSTVIEASIIESDSESRVIITKSTDFYNPGVYEKVSDAIIIVNDSEGNSFEFNETIDGVYENRVISGKSGIEYSIEVVSEGITYDAVSNMPNKLILDSLGLAEAPQRPNSKEESFRFYLHLYFQDQLEIDDYCRIKLYSNGVPLDGFNLYEDKLTDGNYIDYRLLVSNEHGNVKLGDVMRVELMSIDQAAFEYYKTANSVNASNSGRGPSSTSAAPANPVTNWSNNALGFFSAYAVSSSSIEIRR